MLLLPMAAMAQKLDYQVVVEAPANVKAVIVDNLALIKLRNNQRIDIAQLKRLFEEAKSEIDTLVSTEGYFAPTIDATLAHATRRDLQTGNLGGGQAEIASANDRIPLSAGNHC